MDTEVNGVAAASFPHRKKPERKSEAPKNFWGIFDEESKMCRAAAFGVFILFLWAIAHQLGLIKEWNPSSPVKSAEAAAVREVPHDGP